MTKKEFKSLKVGDKVRIVRAVPKKNDSPMLIESMEKYLGKIMTIKKWDVSIFSNDVVRMEEDNGQWIWDAKMIEKKVDHFRVLCTGCLDKEGYAKDLFTKGKVYDVVDGMIKMDKTVFGEDSITFALGIRPINYKFEVVNESSIVRAICVKSEYGMDKHFTAGKIYERINSKVYDDLGWPWTAVTTSENPARWGFIGANFEKFEDGKTYSFAKLTDKDKIEPAIPVCHELRDAIIDSVKGYVDERVDEAILKHEEDKHKDKPVKPPFTLVARGNGKSRLTMKKLFEDMDVCSYFGCYPCCGVKEVKRRAKPGEWIKIVEKAYRSDPYNNGDILEVATDACCDMMVRVYIGDENRQVLVYHSEYVVLEGYKPAVKEVKRTAKVGEYIKIVDKVSYERRYNNGDIFKVKLVRDDGVVEFVTKKDSCTPAFSFEYVVLENYIPEVKELKRDDVGELTMTINTDFAEKFANAIRKSVGRICRIKPEVKEVKRKAEINEYVKIIDKAAWWKETYKNGDIFKVKGISKCNNAQVIINDDIEPLLDEEYVVLEGYEPSK